VGKPFHKLHDKTWLHDRPVEDVYKLLIDVYRLRLEDDYNLEGKADRGGIYGGATDGGRNGFRRFLMLVASRHGLLPTWWTPEKGDECIELGMTGGGVWSDLGKKAKKGDIISHYGDSAMPMQFRLFGEQVYGTGPGGHSGVSVLQMQMASEKGEVFTSVISLV
jgi:splicing suppressor protein 51